MECQYVSETVNVYQRQHAGDEVNPQGYELSAIIHKSLLTEDAQSRSHRLRRSRSAGLRTGKENETSVIQAQTFPHLDKEKEKVREDKGNAYRYACLG